MTCFFFLISLPHPQQGDTVVYNTLTQEQLNASWIPHAALSCVSMFYCNSIADCGESENSIVIHRQDYCSVGGVAIASVLKILLTYSKYKLLHNTE